MSLHNSTGSVSDEQPLGEEFDTYDQATAYYQQQESRQHINTVAEDLCKSFQDKLQLVENRLKLSEEENGRLKKIVGNINQNYDEKVNPFIENANEISEEKKKLHYEVAIRFVRDNLKKNPTSTVPNALMNVALINAGAKRGVFIDRRDVRKLIEAQGFKYKHSGPNYYYEGCELLESPELVRNPIKYDKVPENPLSPAPTQNPFSIPPALSKTPRK